MINKILVPLDGSELANAILPHVIALARVEGATITLLHVVETNIQSATETDPVTWSLRKTEAEAYLAETVERLRRFDLDTECNVLEGRPRSVLFNLRGMGDLNSLR